ncbi:MAG: hypothetical protein O7D91_06275 [Planctomycetota bacterium]|nr:hypothetical protein [Planctomycetota bacterium]
MRKATYSPSTGVGHTELGQRGEGATQFLLIDSDLVEPEQELAGFEQRRMAGEAGAPSLIPYYDGP